MTHEVTLKIDGKPVKFRFGTRAFYRTAQHRETDLAGLLKQASSDFIGYWRDICYFAALDCDENKLADLALDDVFTWFDTIPEKDIDRLYEAHRNARVLGKAIMR